MGALAETLTSDRSVRLNYHVLSGAPSIDKQENRLISGQSDRLPVLIDVRYRLMVDFLDDVSAIQF